MQLRINCLISEELRIDLPIVFEGIFGHQPHWTIATIVAVTNRTTLALNNEYEEKPPHPCSKDTLSALVQIQGSVLDILLISS